MEIITDSNAMIYIIRQDLIELEIGYFLSDKLILFVNSPSCFWFPPHDFDNIANGSILKSQSFDLFFFRPGPGGNGLRIDDFYPTLVIYVHSSHSSLQATPFSKHVPNIMF